MIQINKSKLQQIQNDKRRSEIQSRLYEIDTESLRAVRATILKKNTKKDDETLTNLEAEAEILRLELKEI